VISKKHEFSKVVIFIASIDVIRSGMRKMVVGTHLINWRGRTISWPMSKSMALFISPIDVT
jgi:hypothetical protein